MNQHEILHAARMHELMARHEVLPGLIGDKPFHYVDIPVHGNIGDLLIMHGTLAFFRKNNLAPKVIAPAFSYKLDSLKQGEAIVFHGGGNFGDLYAEYGMQELREFAVSNKPGNRIIIMPQTIHFLTEESMQRSAKVFRTHPDVHLCVRDSASYAIAQRFTDNVYLLPDMAHQLYPVVLDESASPSLSTKGTLLISRMDSEKRDFQGTAYNETAVTDWPLLVGDNERRIELFRRAMRVMHKFGMGWGGNRVLSPAWVDYSGRLIKDAVALFSSYEHIVTDRLHGHILACLMDKANTVLDNSYGKNSSYVNAWTINSPLTSLQKF